ncbi:MAG TPA: DNA polymerase, partial [Prochlorococcaceae cyanobacterium AMR_MDS_5431]|nr:DNA polymerase [Prochlorococcaceae cyanobacterium AMR_MDS_5431]
GTVHPNLRSIGADTGRMSCPTAFKGSVPSGEFTKTGKAKTKTITLGATLHGAPNSTRDFFVSRPGYVMIDADFSAIEVRLAAHMYADPAMTELALNPDIDAHRRMASKIFSVTEDEVTSEQRKVGKTANFALQYGCGVNKLHAQLESVLGRKVDYEEANKAYETWHKTHYMISQRMSYFRDKSKPKYFLRSPLGRLMGMPDPSNRRRKNKWGQMQPVPGPLIHTNGVNWPIQSAGKDLLAEAAILVWQRLVAIEPRVIPLHLVHDEILVEVPEDMVNRAVDIIRGCMSDADLQKRYLGDIPLECEVLSGKRWSEVH